MQVITRLRDEYRMHIPLRVLFDNPIVSALAEGVTRLSTECEAESADRAVIVPGKGRDQEGLISRVQSLREDEIDELLEELEEPGSLLP